MKRRFTTYLFIVFLIGSFAELFAAGTPAGTVIRSRSRVTFSSKSGSQIDTVYSAYVSFTVAQKGAFNATPLTNSITTQSDSTFADYAALLINSGNGNDRAKISAVSSKGWVIQLYSDGNGDGILQTNEVNSGLISLSSLLAADVSYPIIVRVAVPRDETLNGTKDTTSVTVKSNFDSTKLIIGKYITTVRTTGLNALNPGLTVNNPTPSVGQQITYSFVLTNNGGVTVNSLSISDKIPGGLSVVSGNTTQGTFINNTNPITWNIGTLSPSQSITVTVTMQLNSGLTNGMVIPNQFGIQYSTGSNTYTIASNIVLVTVSGKLEYGIEITPMFTSLTKEASDTAWHGVKIKNTGSLKDLFELNVTSSQNLAWKLYRDRNNNGVWDSSDPVLTNTNDSADVDIDTLVAGDSVRVFAQAIVPRFESDLLQDTLHWHAVSAGDHSKFDTKHVVTIMKVPMVRIEKSVFPVGDQPAGSIIGYTIKYFNDGSVGVKDFSVIDTAPIQTNYVINSVKVNGVSVSDNEGGVSITKDESNGTVISVSIGALAANTNGSVEFKVKIK